VKNEYALDEFKMKGKTMKFLKELKLNVTIGAVLTIALGILLIINPQTLPIMVCKLIGIFLLVMGGFNVITNLISSEKGTFHLIGSLIIFVLGLWFFLKPASVLSLIPIVMGIILIIHGLQDLKLGIEAKSNHYEKWVVILLTGILSLILGVVCVAAAFEVLKFGMIMIGIALVYDGVSDIWIVSRVSKSARQFQRDYKASKEAIDVEFEEEDID
jgi:uncharacterized membrane protein HdeD (DUF308 family)